jgi:putative CocE/NonD family hydrolase
VPQARIYTTGANAWRALDTYPPKDVKERTLHLASGGHANTSAGDGRLRWEAADEKAAAADHFVFDPRHPVPGALGEWGLDRQEVERRDDVLVYTSDALEQPLEIAGAVTVRLQAATDGRDSDFTAVLTDVGPDGRALMLGPLAGIRRGRYRNGYAREELLTPGKVEEWNIALFDVAHSFLPGHRIRLEISSSNAPLYTPNQNTGNPVATDVEWRVAHQTVLHGRGRDSVLVLPVVERR